MFSIDLLPCFNHLEVLETIVIKGKNAAIKHFLPFPKCLYPIKGKPFEPLPNCL